MQSSNNKLDNTVYILNETLSSVDEAVIRGSVIKAYDLIEKKSVISGFNENNYFVKSYCHPNGFLHNIKIDEKGLIKCDSTCPRYNADGFCSHAIAVSLQTNNLKKYACALSKCEERNTAAIVSQKIDIKKVRLKSVARSRKKQIGSPKKEVRVASQNAFINPNESLATSGRITEGIQRLPAPMVTFPDEFIGGLFQGMLNADLAAPSHDLMQAFNRELNNLNHESILTVLAKYDARVTICYGCSLNFK